MNWIWTMQGGLDFLFLLLAMLLWYSQRQSEAGSTAQGASDLMESRIRELERQAAAGRQRVEETLQQWKRQIALREEGITPLSDQEIQVRCERMEKRLSQQSKDYFQRFESELASLNRICERAKNLLTHGQGFYLPSDEEFELKAAISADKASAEIDEIPSLYQIEQTKQRLKSEITVDLRSLLKDQLA